METSNINYEIDPETGESSRLNTSVRTGKNFISQDLPAYSARFIVVDRSENKNY